jgi:hypothetical protein
MVSANRFWYTIGMENVALLRRVEVEFRHDAHEEA